MLRNCQIGFGILGLVLFAWSGWYMANVLGVPDLTDRDRLLYRSGHLYMLFGFMVTLIAGLFSTPGRRYSIFEKLCSSLFVIAAVMIAWGFFNENNGETIDRAVTRLGLLILFFTAAPLTLHKLWQLKKGE